MQKFILIFIGIFLLCTDTTNAENSSLRSPYKIIDQAPASSWQELDPENTLLIELENGQVVIALAPQFAPLHVTNIKALAREGFYDGLNFYRVIDNFVAQGGDASNKKTIQNAQRAVHEERFTTNKLKMTVIDTQDGFAKETGFVGRFPAASDGDKTWMVHCPGLVAMGRGDDVNSGGTEIYIVIGQSPRYLDKNTSAFGRVVYGMEHIQALQRRVPQGDEIDTSYNPIQSISVLADVDKTRYPHIQTMRTDSSDFAELVESRRNRPENWFVERPSYVDVCGVSIPSKVQK